MEKKIKVAVYGTLRMFQNNWKRLLENNSDFLGIYETDPHYTMYDTGGFPIVTDTGHTSITYEVYSVTENVLNNLNRLEGCTGITGHPSNWYDIVKIETPVGIAFMYVMHEQKELPIIKSGNWILK